MAGRIAQARTVGVGLAVAILAGCSSKGKDQPVSETESRLYTIGKAYIQASAKLNRGPKDFQEIKPYLPPNTRDDVRQSPGDGQDFVILWGVDFNKLPAGTNPYYVGAYEKSGKSGQRYVLRFPIGVVNMTDEELRSAQFPPGHKPPS